MDTILSHVTSPYIIRTQRLTKAFGSLVAVNDLDLEVMRGDVFGFLGPNGAGKTTTIRMLLGLIRPTAGHIDMFGTLGRSTVAAIVAPFIWYITEQILNNLLSGFVGSSSGPISDLVKVIPDYFVGNNIYALLQNQAHLVFGASASSLSDLHALSVLGAYIALFITLSCWLTVKRDVTN